MDKGKDEVLVQARAALQMVLDMNSMAAGRYYRKYYNQSYKGDYIKAIRKTIELIDMLV